MSQNIKIIPNYQRTVLTPSMRVIDTALMTIDYGGDLEVVEVAEELNDAAKLKESSTFDADIPYNTNNRWIVDKYGNSIPILVNAHGVQLPDRSMRVNGYSEASANFDVSFVRSQEWPEIFKTLALNSLDGFDPFQLSEAFIDNNQLNDAAYPGAGQTPTRGFYTPLAYYGGLNRFNEANSLFELTYADYRLWFHYGKILGECFFSAGYKMDCPLLLTPYGQRLSWYLVGNEKIYDGFQAAQFPNKLQLPASKNYAFRAENTSDQVMTGSGDAAWFDSERIFFQNDSTGKNYDNGETVDGGFWKTSNNSIHGFSGKWKLKGRLIITGGASPQSSTLQFFLNTPFSTQKPIRQVFYDEGGNVISNTSGQLILSIPGGSVTTAFEFDAAVESVAAFKDIGFGFDSATGANLTIKTGSYIQGNGEFVVIMLQPTTPGGDTINKTIVFPQSWLSKDIKAIDVLEEYCHITNSKIYTDRARRIVGIYTEQDVPTYGVNTEPYYFDTIEQDLSLMQVENSVQVNLKDVVTPGKYILGFKESTDEYIASITKETPFDAVIYMEGYGANIDPDKTFENRSNLVEPTLERDFVEIRMNNPSAKPPSVMAVLDNLVGETSTKTQPRTAYIYGIVRQKNGAADKQFKKRWGGVTTSSSLVAYATQYPSGIIKTAGGADIDNDKTLVYDHTEAVSEPMKRYWIDTIRVLYTRETRRLTVIAGSFNRFIQMNFRDLYHFKFMGLDWKGRIVTKRTKVNEFQKVEIEVREEKPC